MWRVLFVLALGACEFQVDPLSLNGVEGPDLASTSSMIDLSMTNDLLTMNQSKSDFAVHDLTPPPDLIPPHDLTTCQQGCSSCGSGCCNDQCGIVNCTQSCPGGCSCNLNCGGSGSCSQSCAGGSTCTGSASGTGSATFSCAGGATCSFSCSFAGSCSLSCSGGAHCRLSCSNSGSCDLTGCSPTTCPDGSLVCNQSC